MTKTETVTNTAWVPLSTYCLVERLPAKEHSEGGIALPDVAQRQVHEGLVTRRGIGRILKDGSRHVPQVNSGDRVIVRYFDWTALDEQHAFLADELLVAKREWAGDGWGPLTACNDWVLVEPDPTPTIFERASGVVVVNMTTLSGTGRVRQEAEHAYEEIGKLEERQAYRDEPNQYFRDKHVHDYLTGLRPEVLEEVYRIDAEHKSGRFQSKHHRYRALLQKAQPKTGVLVNAGPGKFTAQAGGRVPMFYDGVPLGKRVRWGKSFCGLWIDGLLALPAHVLDAVEE